MIRYAWLICFPLMFLPNLGYARETAYGMLQISDFLIGPYILLVLLASGKKRTENPDVLAVRWIMTPLIFFIAWAALSTLSINMRYGYSSSYYIRFGLLKIGKMALYLVAGLLTVRVLTKEEMRLKFLWALLASGVVVGINLYLTRNIGGYHDPIVQMEAYRATNGISVLLAVLLCFLVACHVYHAGTFLWRRALLFSYLPILIGFLVSNGRGGWFAAIIGMLYLLYRRGRIRTAIIIGVAGTVIIVAGYQNFPEFRSQIDRTFLKAPSELQKQHNVVFSNISEGGRIYIWLHEAPKVGNAPVFGTGFFHRGGRSGLWTTGSHNFWIQMFLETGLVGSMLVLIVVRRIWRESTFFEKAGEALAAPAQIAFVAAFVGGMTGDYFYGGMPLFTLLSIYALIGSLPVPQKRSSRSDSRRHRAPRKLDDHKQQTLIHRG